MRKQIIICDGCGNLIEEAPLKLWAEYTDRETGEYSLDIQDEVTKKISPDKEYCKGCIEQIGQFLKNLPGSSTKSVEKPINTECEVDSEKSAAAVRKVVNCTPEVMKKCKYGSTTSSLNTSTLCCDYLSKVGHSRGCNPTECDKFEKRK